MCSAREKKKITKRKCILEAALNLFSKKGYEHTSIEELAKEAGIGKGTVYSYFNTKKDIVRAFYEDEIEYVREELAANTNPESSLKDQLKIIFMAEFKYVTRNSEFGRLYLQEKVFPKNHYSEEDLAVQFKHFEFLHPIYQKAKDRGELRNDLELLHVSGHFYAIYLLIMSCWYTGMIPIDEIGEAMETLLKQTIDGLKPQTEQTGD